MNTTVNRNYWASFIDVVARASTCRKKLGAVLVYQKHIIGMGYTGSIHGDVHCNDNGCLSVPNNNEYGSGDSTSCIRTVHAEMNAILNIQYPIYTVEHSKRKIDCYSTYRPCLNCTKALLQIGVTSFYYKKNYLDVNRELFINSLSNNILKTLLFFHYYEGEQDR